MNHDVRLILAALGWALSCSPSASEPTPEATPEARLKALELRLTRLGRGDLPDFAPGLSESARARVAAVRRVADAERRVPADALEQAVAEVDRFERAATAVQETFGDVYALRNSASTLNFVRAYAPRQFYRAEQGYEQAMKLAHAGDLARLRSSVESLRKQYRSLIQGARGDLKSRGQPIAKAHQAALNADLAALNSPATGGVALAAADGAFHRLGLGAGFGNGGLLDGLDGLPPYDPPPPPVGPRPPAGVGVDQITAHSVRITLADVSDDEIGNRLLRSTDLSAWPVVAELGAIPKLTTHSHTDLNLQPETRYCYQVETHNAEGARKSQFVCAYTASDSAISVWRLELRVRVANLEHAGSDNPLRVMVDGNGEFLATETFLDYGRDDFERNSDFTFDLNFDHLEELSDISGLRIQNHGSDDHLQIRELALLVNHHEVFTRVFGNTNGSALDLGDYGGFAVDHAELRNNPAWGGFVAASASDRTFNLPPVRVAENGRLQVEISREEVVSRIESLVGHLLHADASLRDRLTWGELDGPAVEVSRVDSSNIRIDLDLEVTINNLPNPDLDLDFEMQVTKRCDQNDAHRMLIDLKSKNFTADADYPLWLDIVSLGSSKLVADVADALAKECVTPPDISRTVAVQLPPQIACGDLSVGFDADSNLEICCFSLDSAPPNPGGGNAPPVGPGGAQPP
jgi:hypothetical protein